MTACSIGPHRAGRLFGDVFADKPNSDDAVANVLDLVDRLVVCVALSGGRFRSLGGVEMTR
jgi:hypothetical protein